jgi:quinol monooxygenase YgiN
MNHPHHSHFLEKTMILLIARLRIAAEDIKNFREAVAEFLAASRAETGCIRFTVSEDIEQPYYFLFTEIWEDEASLESHEASAHLSYFKQQIGGYIVEGETSRVYDVKSARDL